MQGKNVDLIGKKFNKLTVISKFKYPNKQGNFWMCKCDCGNFSKKPITTNCLIKNKTQSCGCLKIENIKKSNSTHKMTKTRTYTSWQSMWARCTNTKHKSYEYYKNKTPVDRWKSFENFLIDMGERPENSSLERININERYSPENCKWATTSEQARNKSTNIYIYLNDKKLILKDACRELNIPYIRTKNRLYKGWAVEEAIYKPKWHQRES